MHISNRKLSPPRILAGLGLVTICNSCLCSAKADLRSSESDISRQALTTMPTIETVDVRLRKLDDGVIGWPELTSDEQTSSVFIATALRHERSREPALKMLTKEILNDEQVQDSLVKIFEGYVTVPREVRQLILDNKQLLSKVCNQNLIKYESGRVWENYLKLATPESTVTLQKQISAGYAELYSKFDLSKVERPGIMFTLPPEEVRSTERLKQIFKDNIIKGKDLSDFLPLAKSYGFSAQEIFDFAQPELNSPNGSKREVAREAVLSSLTRDLVRLGGMRSLVLNSIREGNWFKIPKDVYTDPKFIDILIDETKKDFLFAAKIPHTFYNDKLKQSLLTILSEPQHKQALVDTLHRVDNLPSIPFIALEIPEICLRARAVCNEAIYADFTADTHFIEGLRDNIKEYVKKVPEILRVPNVIGSFDIIEGLTESDLVSYNPGAFKELLNIQAAPPREAIEQFARANEALRLLGITGVNRFDSAYDILRVRFSLADDDVKLSLRTLLPAEYFDGIEVDTRPICIFIISATSSDHNNVFSSINDSYKHRDYIDRLSVHYRIAYYEVASEAELAKRANELHAKGVTSELLFIAGHGEMGSIALGDQFTTEGGSLTQDSKKLRYLDGLVKDGGNVVLLSCSTGAGKNDAKSILNAFIRVFPNANIYAPTEDTMPLRLNLQNDGRFYSVNFVDAETARYDANSKHINLESGVNRYVELFDQIFHSHPFSTIVTAVVLLDFLKTGLVYSYKLIHRISRSLKFARTKEKAPYLYNDMNEGFVRKFSRELFNFDKPIMPIWMHPTTLWNFVFKPRS